MNRNLLRKLIVCALVGSFTAAQPLAAQSDKPAADQQTSLSPTQKKAKRKAYKGRIEAIDLAARTVTVKKAYTSKTFKVADDVKFATSSKNNDSLAPLKVGDLVNVRFTEEGDEPIAHHIAQAPTRAKAE